MDQQMGLLDRLARMSGCACLSDLRTPAYRHPVLDALGRISAEEYPAKEWLEAMGYRWFRCRRTADIRYSIQLLLTLTH